MELELWGIPQRVRDPLAAEMRLAWWRKALLALDRTPPPAQPLLLAAAAHLLPVTGCAVLAGLEDAPLLALGGADSVEVAAQRGRALFGAAAVVLGGTAEPGLGAAWAVGEAVRAGAAVAPAAAASGPRRLRPLVALDRLGVRDQNRPPHPPELRGSMARQLVIGKTVLFG